MAPSRLHSGWARLAAAAGTAAVLAAVSTAVSTTAAAASATLAARTTFTPDEVAQILQHGPWPPRRVPDASNRVAASARAAAFGQRLFFDTRLSSSGTISCASCHLPEFQWTDRRPTATGLGEAERNTPSVANTRFNRWFGWAGATDSLWSASLRPFADTREMGSSERHVAAIVRSQPDLECSYRQVFGEPPAAAEDDKVLADIGKALAAFQATLVTGRTPFDDFRDALARSDLSAQARYPEAAKRGLRLFIGRGQCSLCHLGPQFSNGEFDQVGIPVRRADGRFDWGRYDGIKAVRASRFSLLGRFNDDRKGTTGESSRRVALTGEAYGQFKVPGLRNAALTAPYMHDGSITTLTSVVRHYSTINDEKLILAAPHPHAEPGEELPERLTGSLLRTLNLDPREITDLVAFLETLTETRTGPNRRPPPAAAGARPTSPGPRPCA
ncbi:MAG: cytochrome-c peroxidase [bacterium]|jgi:cytochrome c peroxidase